jgi:hypothetical protein
MHFAKDKTIRKLPFYKDSYGSGPLSATTPWDSGVAIVHSSPGKITLFFSPHPEKITNRQTMMPNILNALIFLFIRPQLVKIG